MTLTINRSALIKGWALLIAALALFSLAASIAGLQVQDSSLPARTRELVKGLAALLSVDSEMSLPTWFSIIGLFNCALLLAVTTRVTAVNHGRFAYRWALLAFGFLFLCADEAISLHERTISFSREVVKWATGGFVVQNAWVVPAIPLLLVAVVIYRPLFLSLPSLIRVRFFMASAMYVGGAMVAELISGQIGSAFGSQHVLYVVFFHVEEILEMAGVLLFADALLLNLNVQTAGQPLELTIN